MGKILIIKGVDFSANAVAFEPIEPSVYTDVAGVGATYTGYSEGQVFYRCNAAIERTGTGLFVKTASNRERTSLAVGSKLKIGDLYYSVAGKNNIFIEPYYGVSKLDVVYTSGTGYKFVDVSTTPNTVSGSYKSCILNLQAGKKYIIYGTGTTSSTTVAIVKHSDNSYERLENTKAGLYFLEYTAAEGDVLYYTNYMINSNDVYFIAIVED